MNPLLIAEIIHIREKIDHLAFRKRQLIKLKNSRNFQSLAGVYHALDYVDADGMLEISELMHDFNEKIDAKIAKFEFQVFELNKELEKLLDKS